MKSKIFSFLQYFIFLGGGLLLVWWQLHGMTDKEKVDFKLAITHANYILVLPVILMSLGSHLIRSMRWQLLMEPLGFKPTLKNTFAVTMVGYLANSAVNRLGEVLKCTMLSKYENLKTDKLIGTIVIERVIDLICFFILICITILLQLGVIGDFIKGKLSLLENSSSIPIWQKILIAVLILFVVIFIFKKIISLYPNNKLLIKIKDFSGGILSGITSVKKLKRRKLFLFYTTIIWGLYLLQIYTGFKAMESTAILGFKAACTILTMSTIAMIITPGGIGFFPLFIMETLVIYGVPDTQGKAYGWLIWGVSTSIIIIVGLLSLILLPYINKKKNEIQ